MLDEFLLTVNVLHLSSLHCRPKLSYFKVSTGNSSLLLGLQIDLLCSVEILRENASLVYRKLLYTAPISLYQNNYVDERKKRMMMLMMTMTIMLMRRVGKHTATLNMDPTTPTHSQTHNTTKPMSQSVYPDRAYNNLSYTTQPLRPILLSQRHPFHFLLMRKS